MTEDSYPFQAKPLEMRYDFTSISDEKTVEKTVIFSQLTTDLFNVALLDVLADGTLSDDLVVTNNQDLRTVMATVMRIIDDFLTRFPDRTVFFRGSDDRRTRLYQIVIGREIDLIRQQFTVEGIIEQQIEQFVINRLYSGFFISKNG